MCKSAKIRTAQIVIDFGKKHEKRTTRKINKGVLQQAAQNIVYSVFIYSHRGGYWRVLILVCTSIANDYCILGFFFARGLNSRF